MNSSESEQSKRWPPVPPPVLPNDLSYPELVPEEVHDETLYENDEDLDRLLLQVVTEPDPVITGIVAAAMKAYSWDTVAPRYDELLGR